LLQVQQKISGTFRSESGALAGTRLRSYLSTLARQRHALLAAPGTVVACQPLHPELA
jgi:hypothetical protein